MVQMQNWNRFFERSTHANQKSLKGRKKYIPARFLFQIDSVIWILCNEQVQLETQMLPSVVQIINVPALIENDELIDLKRKDKKIKEKEFGWIE